jgi:hypothetical protein
MIPMQEPKKKEGTAISNNENKIDLGMLVCEGLLVL